MATAADIFLASLKGSSSLGGVPPYSPPGEVPRSSPANAPTDGSSRAGDNALNELQQLGVKSYNPNGGFAEEFGAGMRGALDTATFGFLDEASGFLATALGGGGEGQQSYWTGNRSWSDALSHNIAVERAVQKADNEFYFKSRLGGQIGGALVIPMGAGAKGALQVAKVGAAQGAAYGFGSGEDTLGNRLGQAAVGGVTGGIAGGVLGKVGEVVAPYASKAWNATKGLFGKEGQQAVEAGAQALATDVAQQGDNLAADAGQLAPEPKTSPILGRAGPNDEPIIRDPASPEAPNPKAVEDVPLTAPPREGQAAGEHVGSISRAGLEELQAEVEKFRGAISSEGTRAVDITTASPEAKTIGEFRLGNLGDGEDTLSLLGALTRQLPSKGVRSDVELMATAQKAVADIGENDPEAFLAYAQQAAGKLGDVDTTMAVLRTIWKKAADEIDIFHGAGVDWATASDDLVQSAGTSIRNLSLLSREVQTAKAALGRGLRVNSLPDAESYAAALAHGEAPAVAPRELPTLPTTREELGNWFDLWGMTGKDPKLQAKFLQGVLTVPSSGKYLRSSFANFFTASILSAPRTVLLNLVGPGVISVVRNIERASGAAVASLNPFLSAQERAAMRTLATQAPKAYLQTFGEVRDAFSQAIRAAEANHTLVGGGGQTVDAFGNYGPWTKNLLKAAGTDPDWKYTLGNLVNVWPRAFARVNNGLDEFSKRLAYQGEVRVNAQMEGIGKGLSGDDLAEFVSQKMTAAYDEAGHATDQAMLRSAERTTLTGEVGSDGGWVRRFSQGVQQMRRDVPELRYILPVFNVPANALGETIRRLPIAFLPKVGKTWLPEAAADLAGSNGVVAQADAYGRHLLGAGFLTSGLLLTRSGLLTGAGPQDPTDRKVWLQTHQPYSLRVGDSWVRYDKFDILGGLLSIPATVSDISVYHKADDSLDGHVMAGVAALAQWFKDRAALRNAMGILSLGDNPTQDPGKVLESIATNAVTGFFPAALRTTLTDTTDPYKRMTRDWEDYMKAVLPGLSRQLEPVRNVLGEPVARPNDTVGEAFFPVTLASATSWKTEPVLDELDRLYQATGYGAGGDPKSLGYGFFDPKDVKLEDGKSMYDHAMQARLEMQVDGKTLKQTLHDLIMSSDYQNGVDGSTSARLTSQGDLSRSYVVAEAFQSFNAAIKGKLASESPLAKAYLTAAAAKNRDSAYLRDIPVEDLVKNPDLYRTRGVDPQTFSDKLGGSSSDLLQALK